MIEIVKENGNVVNKRENPVNVRPIGDPKGNEKVYVEDYIETFIRQIAIKDDCPKVLILYGENKQEDEFIQHFVCGAVLVEEVLTDEKTIFGDLIWKEVNKKAGRFFPNLQVLGWAYIRYDISEFAQGRVQYTHNCCFRKDQNVYIEYSVMEKQEQVYLVKNAKMERQSGHFIYYERNEAMQNYMITMKQEEPEELKPEVDQAAKKCRGIVREKKEELKHRQTMGMLYGTSMAMLLVVTIVGVTLLNNYNKMQDMEAVLHDISNQMAQSEQDEEDALFEMTGAVSQEEMASNTEMEEEQQAVPSTEAESEETSAPVAEEEDSSLNIEADAESDADAVTVTDEPVTEENVSEQEQPEELSEQEVKPDPAIQQEQKQNEEPELVDNTELVMEPGIEVADASADQNFYLIEKGDTLSKISIKFYGDESRVDQICQMNQIADKNAIQYGVNIVLP